MSRLLIVIILLIKSTLVFAEDQCSLILTNGVFDSVIKDENITTNEEKKDFYCSKDFESYINKRSNNDSLGFSFNGYSFNFRANSNNESEKHKLREVCENHYSNINNTHFLKYVQKTASQIILKAYLECIKLTSNPGLVTFTMEDYDNIISFNIKFKGVTGMEYPKITKLIVGGSSLKCEWSSIKKEAVITIEGLFDYCERISDSAAIVIVKTTLGDYKLIIPKKEDILTGGIYTATAEWTSISNEIMPPLTKEYRIMAGAIPRGRSIIPSKKEYTVSSQYHLGSYSISSCEHKNSYGHPRDWTPCYTTDKLVIEEINLSKNTKKLKITNGCTADFLINLSFPQTKTHSKPMSYTNQITFPDDSFTVSIPANAKKATLDVTLNRDGRSFQFNLLHFSDNSIIEKVFDNIENDQRIFKFQLTNPAFFLNSTESFVYELSEEVEFDVSGVG